MAQDMVGTPIIKGDIILYNNRIFKVTNVYTNTLRYTSGVGHSATTYSFERLLVISNFDANRIQQLLDYNADKIEELNREEEKLSKVKTPEEIVAAKAANQQVKLLNKQVDLYSIVFNNGYESFIYLGHKKNPADPTDSTKYHWYVYLGWSRATKSLPNRFNEIYVTKQYNRDDWYSRRTPFKLKAKKIISAVNNEHKEVIKDYLHNIPDVPVDDTRYEAYTQIKSLLK